jgi:ASCH domain
VTRRSLTVRQPWAALIMAGVKDVENRTKPTSFRGRLAIHAALRFADPSAGLVLADVAAALGLCKGAVPRLPRGVVLGTVELHDCRRDSGSRWAIPDQWHWLVRDPRPLPDPVPARGRLGLWSWEGSS